MESKLRMLNSKILSIQAKLVTPLLIHPLFEQRVYEYNRMPNKKNGKSVHIQSSLA